LTQKLSPKNKYVNENTMRTIHTKMIFRKNTIKSKTYVQCSEKLVKTQS